MYVVVCALPFLNLFSSVFALSQKFYRYHEMLHEKEAERAQLVNGGYAARPNYWLIFKQAFPQLFNIFFVFFVTLAIFPAVHSDIRMSDADFVVGPNLFVSVLCFLTFNVSAMMGSMTTSFVQFVRFKRLGCAGNMNIK